MRSLKDRVDQLNKENGLMLEFLPAISGYLQKFEGQNILNKNGSIKKRILDAMPRLPDPLYLCCEFNMIWIKSRTGICHSAYIADTSNKLEVVHLSRVGVHNWYLIDYDEVCAAKEKADEFASEIRSTMQKFSALFNINIDVREIWK